MAQIIDIEERRKPRSAPTGGAESPSDALALDSFAYVEQLVLPMAMFWRSWLASWGSLWLAPLGLQVSPLVPQSALEAKDSVDPRG
jgi:hypothetical protein